MSNEKITDFTVIQKGKFQLLLFIEGEGEDLYENASEALFQLLKQHKVQYVAIEQIKDNQHIKGNKLRRVRNEYKKMY
jgi:AAA+ ATPase superfamily predicted ATPase